MFGKTAMHEFHIYCSHTNGMCFFPKAKLGLIVFGEASPIKNELN